MKYHCLIFEIDVVLKHCFPFRNNVAIGENQNEVSNKFLNIYQALVTGNLIHFSTIYTFDTKLTITHMF